MNKKIILYLPEGNNKEILSRRKLTSNQLEYIIDKCKIIH